MAIYVAWNAFNKGIAKSDVTDTIRAELLRHMERQRIIAPAQIAVDTGFSVELVYKFIAGRQSIDMAQALVLAYPEVGLRAGEPLVCNHCGRIARPRG